MLRLLADENMPGLEGFCELGELIRLPGRHIEPEDLKEIDILLIRSVTKANELLLKGSRVQFVGSATIGTDHVDLAWLKHAGIQFANAPGCNANAVAEYVLQAILLWCERHKLTPSSLSLGVVGLGNVGRRVADFAQALGVTVLASDPPKLEKDGQLDYAHASLSDVLACDVVTLHVPLTHHGKYATHHLLDKPQLAKLRDNQLLINTCRGSVINNRALLERLQQQPFDCVLDVWEGEPQVMPELLNHVWLGSPHIAGYSYEGKLRGTLMLLDAVNEWLQRPRSPIVIPSAGIITQPLASWKDVLAWLRQAYQIEKDLLQLQASVVSANPSEAFDNLRKNYMLRHELVAWEHKGIIAEELKHIARLLAGKSE